MIKYILLFLFCASTAFAQTPISDARAVDALGYPVLDGQTMTLEGLVISENFRPGGLTFAIYDEANTIGISIFSLDDDLGYTPTIGDFVSVAGTLGQFRGLCQLVATSVTVESTGNPVPDPTVVTTLDEAVESSLVVIEDVSVVDEAQWEAGGSGFNVDMTNGTSTFQIRIDSDVDLYDLAVPTGTFDIVGIVGQFDQTDPLFQGYQLLPRSMSDVQPYIFDGITYTALSIPEAKETDSEGVSTRDGDAVQVSGVIHGINFRPSGLQFTIIDENANGIGVFLFDGQLGLDFAEGKAISIDGRIDQFAGLIQIVPDAITTLAENQGLTPAQNVVVPSEATESAHIEIDVVEYVDDTQWLGDGTSFNVQFLNAAGDTILARVDNDTPFSSMGPLATGGGALLTGIGGQFDTSAPFDAGYQIVLLNMTSLVSTEDILNKYGIEIYPNPVADVLRMNTDYPIQKLTILNLEGKQMGKFSDIQNINLAHLNPGQYLLQFEIENEGVVVPIIKK